MANRIYVETPLIFSKPLSDIAGREVYLKLENVQPSGSFKLRGLSGLCVKKLEEGCKKFVGSSGGNAGLALAYTAEKLQVPCKIFVPDYISERMLKKLRSYGSEIIIGGKDWQEANDEAIKETQKDSEAFLIHPFDHQAIWDTIASLPVEVKKSLGGRKPACFVLSVGGGGLMAGVLTGLERCEWSDVPVLAMETLGADCFNLSMKENKLVSIIPTSIAKTLSTRSIATKIFEMAQKFNVISKVLEDKEAVKGCIKILDDHGFMVEPSCGVTMASIYSKVLPAALEENNIISDGPIVLIVCGGSDITPEILEEFKKRFAI